MFRPTRKTLPPNENLECSVSVFDVRTKKILTFRPCLFATISELKRMCRDATSIPVRCQEILYGGQVISDRRYLSDLAEVYLASSDGDSLSASSASDSFPRRKDPLDLPPKKVKPIRRKNYGKRPKLKVPGLHRPDFTPDSLNFVLRIKRNKTQEFGKITPMHKLSSKCSKNIVKKIMLGMNRRLNPVAISQGFSGSYFLLDQYRNKVAIFKPRHEEPFAPLNPKGFKAKLGTEVHQSGIFSGQQYLREAAAFVMDDKGLFGVPDTFLGSVKHPFFKDSHKRRDIMRLSHYIPEKLTKEDFIIDLLQENSIDQFHKMNHKMTNNMTRIGSVQKVIPNSGDISELSIENLSAFQVQKIALFDMRILNADRNEGNILFRKTKDEIELIPVDHGMCLGTKLKIRESEVVWMNYPQIHLPLDPRLVKYIKALKPKETVQRLTKKLDLPKDVLDLVRISETFLKMCVKRKMTIFEMAQLFYRKEEKKSVLEKIVESIDFMCQESTKRDQWYLQNNILDKTKKINKKTLDKKISKLTRKIKMKKKIINKKLNLNSSNENDGIIIFRNNTSSKKNNLRIKNIKSNSKNKINKKLLFEVNSITPNEKSLESPMTFLSKKMTQEKTPLEFPTFNENDQMKSLNTFSTEHPTSPFIKIKNQLNLISFSSFDAVNEDSKNRTQNKSQTHFNVVDLEPEQNQFIPRRRINSEVIKTSVDKTLPTHSRKKSFFCEVGQFKMDEMVHTDKPQNFAPDNLSKIVISRRELNEEKNSKKSSRSLSVFLIPSVKRSESLDSNCLDDFRQERRNAKIQSFNDVGKADPFELNLACELPKKNLKFHFTKCSLEQFLEGWAKQRLSYSAKRKNTAPIIK
jgi:hypothetical protein